MGVVNQKQQSIEPVDEIAARIERAVSLFGAERLLLHRPQPLRIDLTGGVWYLRGYCPINKAVRNFLIEHMRSIQILEREISDVATKVGEIEDATYVAEATDTEVTVEVTPEAYRLISEFQTLTEPKDVGSGTIRTQIKVGHLPNLGRLIAKYGGAARVIAPEEAREIVRNYALSALGAQGREIDREVE